MIYYTTEFWELVLDVIALFLCGIVLLHLIRNRGKYNQLLLKKPEKENSNNFNEEVATQLVKQQSDRSFETISNVIEKERMLLHNLMENKEVIKDKKNAHRAIGRNASKKNKEVIKDKKNAYRAIGRNASKKKKKKKKEAIKEKKPFFADETGQVQEDIYNKNSTGSGDLAGDKYNEVSRLADLGLSAKQISERAKIPMGEVELIVKLKGLGS